MNGNPEGRQAATADTPGGFDPREAAQLLERTSREAGRQFSLASPLLNALSGAVLLVAYGALWLSVRGQSPYTGPNLGVIALVYTAVAVVIAASTKVYQRAMAGISGTSVRLRAAEGVAILVSFVGGSPVIQGALKEYGASATIVYGVIPAAAPLIIVGTTAAGIAATREAWPLLASSLTVVAAGIVAAFVGPVAAWLVAGIGLCIGMVVYPATEVALRRGLVASA